MVNTCASSRVFINSVFTPAELVGIGTAFTSLLVKRLQRLFGSRAALLSPFTRSPG
jgi:hypothetical protein